MKIWLQQIIRYLILALISIGNPPNGLFQNQMTYYAAFNLFTVCQSNKISVWSSNFSI